MTRVNWVAWKPLYEEILADFGFSREADLAARDELRALLDERLWGAGDEAIRAWSKSRDAFRDRIAGRETCIVGAAATSADLARIPADAPTLVTDGAAHVALPRLRPDAIVTDLDGDVEAQARANAAGVPLFVHAHGDNRDALRKWVPRLEGIVWGTTQAAPLPPTWNHGGFTDGDRACCIAAAFGASGLALVGFDFDTPVQKAGADVSMKKRKLAWAKRIIEGLDVPVRHV